MGRDFRRDGFWNRVRLVLFTNLPTLWRIVTAIRPLRCWVNKFLINQAANRAPNRPHRLSTMAVKGVAGRVNPANPASNYTSPMASYTSWESLTDPNWFGRHRPPRVMPVQPPQADMAGLFTIPAGKDPVPSPKSIEVETSAPSASREAEASTMTASETRVSSGAVNDATGGAFP